MDGRTGTIGLLIPGMRRAPTSAMVLGKLLQRDVVTIDENASVLEAARLMRAEHVGDVVAVGAERRPIGILTDRDIVVGVLAKDIEHLSTLSVKEVLTRDPMVALEDEHTEAVLARMKRCGVRRVPVVDREGKLVGIFSVDDLLGLLARDLSDVASLMTTQRTREERRRP